ncbi:MAG: hypothetical protein CMM50_10045 [Rhodospirillaceae bacterium]|nr:hypothetical protein [Rhodospirillaceae bacterium]
MVEQARMTRYCEQYYSERPRAVGGTSYLAQVGHTVLGKPIDDGQRDSLVDQIRDLLDLDPNDHLLDLCCGNGLFTCRLGLTCEDVVGIDVSSSLLEIARAAHSRENISYYKGDILDLDLASLGVKSAGGFNKILMYAALQHFNLDRFEDILRFMTGVAAPGFVILIGFVPDRDKKWRFYNSPRRKIAHVLRALSGHELFGTWWRKEYIQGICGRLDLECSFHELPEGLHASTYRFHIRITRQDQ